MKILLTWSDRSPGWSKRGHSDMGPIMRLVTMGDVDYDAAIVLSTRVTRSASRGLIADLMGYIDQVDLKILNLPDPSDHGALFEALGPVLKALPDEDLDVVLSAGTPQAQTLWVILVQANLLNARMLQVIPQRFVPHLHPNAVREVRLDIKGFPQIRALREEVIRLRARVALVTGQMVGNSPPMRHLVERLGRVAASTVSVLVLGETGVGKELVAQAIHDASDRAEQSFVAENCGAFTEAALTSELFGHEIGAFTGATSRRRGLFEQADGGTLFLDEVGELSPATQVRLLRVLQEGTLRRMGAETPITVDVRVIAATHQDLDAMVKAGTLREDLLYRLRGASLTVPPLRDRLGDLEHLVVHFLKQTASDLRVTRPTWQALQRYDWPGNVRQLQTEVRRWTVFCDDVVELDDLAQEIRAGATPVLAADPPIENPQTLAEVVDSAERAAIFNALQRYESNLSATARALKIDRNTLKRKLSKWGMR